MVPLPEVVVPEHGVQPQIAGIMGGAVVDLEVPVEGEPVFHLDVDIRQARLAPR